MTDYEKKIDELIEKKLAAALEQITKQKADTTAQYQTKKEQAQAETQHQMRGAYADYAKNIDPTGIASEVLAAKGLDDSGKSETAKVGYYNVYQNALAQIRSLGQEQLDALSQEERQAIAALDAADTKAKENAYAGMMEELIRRQEAAVKQAQSDRQYQLDQQAQALKEKQAERDYQLALAAQALKEKQAAQAQANADRSYQLSLSKSSKSATTTSTGKTTDQKTVRNYPVDGSENERYLWLKNRIEEICAEIGPTKLNRQKLIAEATAPYLELAAKDLGNAKYLDLLGLVV